MANKSNTVRIQNALVEAFSTADYYPANYTAADNKLEAIDYDLDPTISPVSVMAMPLSSAFGESESRRSYVLEREEWRWLVRIKFAQGADVEKVEESMLNSPPVVPRSADFTDQVTLIMESVNYIHPPLQQSYSGTVVEFTFNARLSRR